MTFFTRLHELADQLARASAALMAMSDQPELAPGDEQRDVRRAADLAGQAGMLARYVATLNLPRKPYAPPTIERLSPDDPRVQTALRELVTK